MRTFLFIFTVFSLAASLAQAEVRSKELIYTDNGVTMKGFLAYDDRFKGQRPGVLVVHEWWGHNEYARNRARMLAEMGYTALAVDMYGDGKQADHPSDAGRFAGEVARNMPLARSRFDAALKALQQSKTVDHRQIAAIGYCFGGGIVLNMARQGADLKGVASFHGSLGTEMPAQAGKVKARVAVFTGADDPMAPADQVAAFRSEMEAAGVTYTLTSYPGATHAFTNPGADELAARFGMPLAYNADADKDSWAKLGRFLADLFAKAP